MSAPASWGLPYSMITTEAASTMTLTIQLPRWPSAIHAHTGANVQVTMLWSHGMCAHTSRAPQSTLLHAVLATIRATVSTALTSATMPLDSPARAA
eukprot:CAMPEP_0182877190 /NCGR_PEP_ID=MMETSP0034_2-20130328/14603_1 /TAXON_ID=156128 /ORGANISM="Nephroselmis pyriformis, Strain CCMP717" /LENGTH=95 /DNA_ID=CAMNT_0025010019 /DNA_START=175 /DNA_END=459 /DNA_ORIENTATION=+